MDKRQICTSERRSANHHQLKSFDETRCRDDNKEASTAATKGISPFGKQLLGGGEVARKGKIIKGGGEKHQNGGNPTRRWISHPGTSVPDLRLKGRRKKRGRRESRTLLVSRMRRQKNRISDRSNRGMYRAEDAGQ